VERKIFNFFILNIFRISQQSAICQGIHAGHVLYFILNSIQIINDHGENSIYKLCMYILMFCYIRKSKYDFIPTFDRESLGNQSTSHQMTSYSSYIFLLVTIYMRGIRESMQRVARGEYVNE